MNQEKITAQRILKKLMAFVKGSYDVVLPNFYYGGKECDLFRITESDLVIEYEIKISRSDFFADFKKHDGQKHENLKLGDGWKVPNRFFFVVPEGLVTKEEVPPYAGLIYYKKDRFEMVRPAKILHKAKYENYRSICHTLAVRDQAHRKRIDEIRNCDFDKEMNRMKREVEALKKQNKEMSQELWMLKSNRRTINN